MQYFIANYPFCLLCRPALTEIGQTDLLPQMIDVYEAHDEQRRKSIAEERPGPETADIIALIGRQPLNKTINQHRDRQKKQNPKGRMIKSIAQDRRDHADKFSGTAGTDGKRLPFIVERAVGATVAAENDRQPAIEKRFQNLVFKSKFSP